METPVKYVGLREAIELLKTQGVKVRRERYTPKHLGEYLEAIEDEVLRVSLLNLYEAHPAFDKVCAGARHHHWWYGGLSDHCREMIGLGFDLMELYGPELPFTRDDVVVAVFLHDFSKVFMYREISAEEREKAPNKFRPGQVFTYQEGATNILDAENLTAQVLMRFAVPVSKEVWSAVCFAEGGFSAGHFGGLGRPTNTGSRVNHENPLAAFMHILDLYSAMILGRELR